jgi:signal transduction histidine kinase
MSAADCSLYTNIDSPVNYYVLATEEKRNVYLVLKEAMNNCIKYSGCKNIQLLAEKRGNFLVIALMDDGKGFTYNGDNLKTSAVDSGNGLKNMQMRCDEIGWELRINSIVGKGTTISLAGKIKELSTHS